MSKGGRADNLRWFPLLVPIILTVSSCAGTPSPETSGEPPEQPAVQKTLATEDLKPGKPTVTGDIPVQDVPIRESSFALPIPSAVSEAPPEYPWKNELTYLPPVPVVTVIEPPVREPAEERTVDRERTPGEERPAVSITQEATEAPEITTVTDRVPEEDSSDEAFDLGSLEAEAGIPFDYSIDGEGWIFEGSDPEGVRFIRRTIPGGRTEFTLAAPENGTYRIVFLYNNVLEDRAGRAVLTLRLGGSPEADAVEWKDEEEPPETEEAAEPPSIEDIVARGFYQALNEADEAVKAGETDRALEILHLCTRVFGDSRNMDRVYFALASIYEANGPLRDIREAIFYYDKILDDFPASIFYNASRDRVVYLERNFIRIR